MERIVYNAWCTVCGAPVNTAEDWKNHNSCSIGGRRTNWALCPDCRSPNLQLVGGCWVCRDCGWESCGG